MSMEVGGSGMRFSLGDGAYAEIRGDDLYVDNKFMKKVGHNGVVGSVDVRNGELRINGKLVLRKREAPQAPQESDSRSEEQAPVSAASSSSPPARSASVSSPVQNSEIRRVRLPRRISGTRRRSVRRSEGNDVSVEMDRIMGMLSRISGVNLDGTLQQTETTNSDPEPAQFSLFSLDWDPTPLRDDEDEQYQCTICTENMRDVAFLQCGHTSCCVVCARKLQEMCADEDIPRCPKCRSTIVGANRVHLRQ